QRRGKPGAISRIQGDHFLKQDADRPPVCHDVMHCNQDNVLFLSDAEDARSPEWAFAQMKRPMSLSLDQLFYSRFAVSFLKPPHIDQGQLCLAGRVNYLPRNSCLGRKRSSQYFMAADHFVHTLSQDANLQLPRAAKYGCYVVKGVARHELIQKP